MESNINFDREINGINHTYKISIILNNVSPNQKQTINKILDLLEDNEVLIKHYEVLND